MTPTPTPVELARHGLALITGLQDASGAYPASPTFSAYRGYSWFRDGAFIADAVSRAGDAGSAARFFDWCAGVVLDRRERIEEIVRRASTDPVPNAGMLATRFTFDGREGDDDWWDFQLDGYGTFLWAVSQHVRRHATTAGANADVARWVEALRLCAAYVASSWQRPCFDWWEEHEHEVHSSTLGCIAAGLRDVLSLGILDDAVPAQRALGEVEAALREHSVVDGHLVKWWGNPAVDGSLSAVVGLLETFPADDPIVRGTIDAVEHDLVRDDGTFRFLGDTFFGGGQWPLLSCMLGLAHLRVGDRDRAAELLAWAGSTADAALDLPEQVDAHLNDPTYVDEWIERWGTSARPLLWSHAMYIRLALDLDLVTPADLAAGLIHDTGTIPAGAHPHTEDPR